MAKQITLLKIVQKILSDSDSEDVNSINDSEEAMQVASIVEDTFYNIISSRSIPEHEELFTLVSASDLEKPTHFSYPRNMKHLSTLWYDVSVDGSFEYREIDWCDPLAFVIKSDKVSGNFVDVKDREGGTNIRIRNDVAPSYYTSFNDEDLIFNSYDNNVNDTLLSSKTRAFGSVYPEFVISDDYIPDIDNTLFPYLIAESKSVALSVLKGEVNPKIEQAAKRQKSWIQNDMFKTERTNTRNDYGRRGNYGRHRPLRSSYGYS